MATFIWQLHASYNHDRQVRKLLNGGVRHPGQEH